MGFVVGMNSFTRIRVRRCAAPSERPQSTAAYRAGLARTEPLYRRFSASRKNPAPDSE